MLVVDYIVDTLVKKGIDEFFVLNGGAIAPLIDAISRHNTAKMYCFQHEQAASMAAEGFNKAALNRAACVAVTSGPGAQNLLNGVCGCYYDSIPALLITGQVNVSESLDSIQAKPRQVGFQEMTVMECFRPFTKYIAKINEPKSIAQNIQNAVDEMFIGRMGPCLLDIPVNVQMSEMEHEYKEIEYSNEERKNGSSECLHEMNHIKDLILSAARPVFLVGNGARGAREAVNALIYKLQVPVSVAWGGHDLFALDCDDAHALFLGPYGVYGDRAANVAIQNADLLVSLGARLDTRQTGGNLRAFSVESKKIVIDIDKEEIERLSQRGIQVTVGCAIDVGIFISTLSSLLQDKPLDIDPWRSKLSNWKAMLSKEDRPSFPGFISPYSFLQKLNKMIAADAIVAVDTGATLVWCFQVLRAYTKDQRIFSSLGNSSMGYGLPAAIGAALAAPQRPIICLVGDGAFQQNIQELATVAAYNLNIKIFVLNNRGYGIIKQFQKTYLGGRHAAAGELHGQGGTAGFPDFVAIARGYGVPAQRLESVEDLNHDMLTVSGPTVYDLNISEEQDIRPKTEFGNSLENMTPFVDLPEDIFVTPPPRRKPTGWVKV